MNSANSGKKANGMNFQSHGMNWAQFKDLLSAICVLAGTMVAPWSLTQE